MKRSAGRVAMPEALVFESRYRKVTWPCMRARMFLLLMATRKT